MDSRSSLSNLPRRQLASAWSRQDPNTSPNAVPQTESDSAADERDPADCGSTGEQPAENTDSFGGVYY